MSRLYICQYCREKDTGDNMKIVKVGKQNKRYHKLNCYNAYLQDQEFKKKEKEELDSLVEAIKGLHGIEIMPQQFFSFLQDIRNGNELFGNVGIKKEKEGYPYSVIEQTYIESKDAIDWAIANVDFKDALNMLKYTRVIIVKNIPKVNHKVQSRKRKQEIEQATEEQAKSVFEHINRQPVEYKRKQSKNDVSDFLD